MKLDPVLIVAAAALALALLSFVALWRIRLAGRSDVEFIRADLETQRGALLDANSGLRLSLEALEQTVRNVPDMPRSGALHRSTRTQALQLLRSGLSPDTAAVSLGMGKREMRLLDRVAQTLWPR